MSFPTNPCRSLILFPVTDEAQNGPGGEAKDAAPAVAVNDAEQGCTLDSFLSVQNIHVLSEKNSEMDLD